MQMNKIIKDIMNKKCSDEEKKKMLDLLTDEIEIARGILSGKFQYCPKCSDYYLAKSFLTDTNAIKAKICIYDDPINSGGNNYVDGYADITYNICPKGHRYEIDRSERLK